MTDEPETERECPACGSGPGRAACAVCDGTGMVTAAQAYHWKLFDQRRRAASSTFPLVESLVRDALAKVSQRDGSAGLVAEGVELLDRWRSTDSLSHEREEAARELREFHRRALDFLAGTGQGE